MKTKIFGKKIVFPEGVGEGEIYTENGKIIGIGKDIMPFDMAFDAGDKYVLPGYIDIHTHGAMGFDFCEADSGGILTAARYHLDCGVTSLMPTITSSTFEKTFKALENAEKAIQSGRIDNNIIGIHLEGPYFSEKQSGAQDKNMITAPIKKDYERLISRFGGIIKRWDYAPESDPNGDFCKYLKEHGILPSAGHTDAKYDDMLVARENGCNLITHLYSCTSTITRERGFRKLGVTECAYLWDDMYAEIICDGKHLPPELLKLIFKLKPNDKLIIVGDSLKVTGLKTKYSSVGTVECIIEDGVCKLLDRSAFAGSIATANMLLRVAVKEAGLNILSAVKMNSETPARLFGLNKGKLAVGYDADIVVADDNFNPEKIYLKGVEVK